MTVKKLKMHMTTIRKLLFKKYDLLVFVCNGLHDAVLK